VIEGKERIKKGQAYVIIANHQSHFDTLALVTTIGVQCRMVAKKELLKFPLFGYAIYAGRHIFVDRSDREAAIRSIREGMNRLPRGVSVVFFAEGSRSPDGVVGRFKKGGFFAAIDSGLPILPVAINGSRSVLAKGSMVFYPGRIEVVVGDPIETHGLRADDVEDLVKMTRDRIISQSAIDHPESNPEGNHNVAREVNDP
jgi:1-acyl-sn-glycerol-3-phosphate acyltransferase